MATLTPQLRRKIALAFTVPVHRVIICVMHTVLLIELEKEELIFILIIVMFFIINKTSLLFTTD
jgi:hypothetical protein